MKAQILKTLAALALIVRHQIIWDPECSAGQEGLAHTVRV